MAEGDFEGDEYRLRAGAPMPVGAGGGRFILQTFGVDHYKITIQPTTKEILSSSDFRGQGGSYVSANYTRLQDKSGEMFSGRLVKSPIFESESSVD